MSAYPKFRDLHLYAGLLLGIPLVVIALTGVMLNHAGRLGLKPLARGKTMSSAHLPDSAAAVTTAAAHAATLPLSVDTAGKADETVRDPQPAGIRSDGGSFTSRPGGWQAYAPAVDAALAAAGELWGDVPLDRIELKHEPERGMVVKIKAAHDVHAIEREIVWSVAQGGIVWRKGPPHAGNEPIDWQRVVHDLHTGKFFSRTYGYWWSDVSGMALVLLGMTGGVLYAIPLLKKRQKRRAPSSPATAVSAPARPRTTAAATSATLGPAATDNAAGHDPSHP